MNDAKVTAYYDALVEEGRIPGYDLLVQQRGQTIYRRTAGYADVEHSAPLPADAMYYMYSCSKPVTVTAGMQLVERGELELDAPVYEYLDAFRDAHVVEDGKTVNVADKLHVRHLFTMTSGLDYNLGREEIRALIAEHPDATTEDVISLLPQRPLSFVPGKAYQYSLSHDALGAVIAAVSHQSLDQYVKENIFLPLGMTRTHFGKPVDDAEGLLPLYAEEPEGKLYLQAGNVYIAGENYHAGGAGLVSTTEEYGAFADAMANGGIGKTGAQILKPETIRQMTEEQLSRLTGKAEFGGEPEIGYSYGLGVRTLISRASGAKSHLGEFGWGGAAGAYLLCDPAIGLSIVYTQHVLNHTGKLDHNFPLRDMVYEMLES